MKAGDRINVSGKKKVDAGEGKQFIVEKGKDFGVCKVQTP